MALKRLCMSFFVIAIYELASSPEVETQPVTNPFGICALLVSKQGYDCQEFQVPTEDGFLLGVQRVSSRTVRASKGPAFLYHGLMQGGDIWVLNEPEQSLGFVLADNGYEVWLGNTRSSKFSYGHVTYTRSDPEFWDWDWDDLVAQDLPTMLHFVNLQTNQAMYYVGYSQGTMTAFAAFTQSATASLVKKAAMLSPIAYLNHVSSPIISAVSWLFLDKVLLLAGVHQFNLSSADGKQLVESACKNIKLTNCYSDLLSLVTVLRTGRFGKYDYGWFRNLGHYGSFFPPQYDLSTIPDNIPFLFAHGGQDELADELDVRHLLEELPRVTEVLFVPNYAHGDFVLGMSARTEVYDKMMLFFENGI